VPPVKPRLWQVSASGTPASHCSLPSTTPSPQTDGGGAQTRSDGLPPVQFPTPEQQFVDPVQGAPAPSAMHCGAVVLVVDDDVVVVGATVDEVVEEDVVVVVGATVDEVVDEDVVVVVGATVVEVVEDDVVVVVGATVVDVVDEVVDVVAGVSLKDQSDQPMRSWPY